MALTHAPNRNPRRRLLAAVLSLALLAAACGDDDASETSSSDDSSSSDDAVVDVEGDFTPQSRERSDDDADTSSYDPSAEAYSDDDAPADDDGFFRDEADREGLFAPEEPRPDPSRLEANTFEDYGVRPFVDTDDDPLSTFALDVDTGSYTVARRWLREGVLPEPAAIRVEELVNAFDYGYDAPRSGLDLHVAGAPSPFDDDNVLVRVGVQAEVIDEEDRANAALTFVVDTSGSMDRDDRLGLVKESLHELVDELDPDDTVAIVIYGDDSSIVLEPTEADDEDRIHDAIDDLRPGGSTNLEAGLRTGYQLAETVFLEGGINRVILASDGVANVGTTDPDRLARDIADRAINGIQLVTIGYGMGNFNDEIMEQLADQGDGFYAYVDDAAEAERLFEDELIATLSPVAIDARIQVAFDEDLVDEYRLIGFENRGVLDRDFRNDDVDAGELSSGHTVTAIYELDLDRDAGGRDELGEITLRWQRPGDREWIEITEDIDFDDIELDWSDVDADVRLATTVAAWAEVLRESQYAGGVDLDDIADEAENLDDELRTEQTEELTELTRLSASLI